MQLEVKAMDKHKVKARDRDQVREDLIDILENAILPEADIHQGHQAVIHQAAVDRDTLPAEAAVTPHRQAADFHPQVDTREDTHQMATEASTLADIHQMATEVDIRVDTHQMIDIHLDIPIDIHPDQLYRRLIGFLQPEMGESRRIRTDYRQETDTHQTKCILTIPETIRSTEIAMTLGMAETGIQMTGIPSENRTDTVADTTGQIIDTATDTTIATLGLHLVEAVTMAVTMKMIETEAADFSRGQTEDHLDRADLMMKDYPTMSAVVIADPYRQVRTVLFTITTLPCQEGPLTIHDATKEKHSNN